MMRLTIYFSQLKLRQEQLAEQHGRYVPMALENRT